MIGRYFCNKKEYESLADRYDKQLQEILEVLPEGKSVEEKIAILREYKYEQYEKLQDATYQRRGWSHKGCPTIEKV